MHQDTTTKLPPASQLEPQALQGSPAGALVQQVWAHRVLLFEAAPTNEAGNCDNHTKQTAPCNKPRLAAATVQPCTAHTAHCDKPQVPDVVPPISTG